MQTKSSADEAMYGFVSCTVRQFMTRTVVTVSRQTTMHELAALFEKHDFNAFPVVEDGSLLGIISKFDFLRAFAFTTSQVVPHYNELMSRVAAEVMTEAVVHVHATSPLTRVLFAGHRAQHSCCYDLANGETEVPEKMCNNSGTTLRTRCGYLSLAAVRDRV
jgi:CBS-domain-containing membrane protein